MKKEKLYSKLDIELDKEVYEHIQNNMGFDKFSEWVNNTYESEFPERMKKRREK